MRLMQRTTVDLPDPDGPINAVTSFAGQSIVIPLTVHCAVVGVQVFDLDVWPAPL